LCGAELKKAVHDIYRPSHLPESPLTMWPSFRIIDTDTDGMIADPFSSQRYPVTGNTADPVYGMGYNAIAPPLWWHYAPSAADSIVRDMHNVLPCNPNVTANKAHYPPLPELTSVAYDNGTWQSGTGMFAGSQINAYTPPMAIRGDIARILMYMITVYDPGRWDMFISRMIHDEPYPALDPEFSAILLEWHHDDPADSHEISRNHGIAAIQGNANPFVDIPELADHIWGTHRQIPWGTTDIADQIRADYRITDTIWLQSPYIPADASWSINGISIDTKSIKASDLGSGEHELRYCTPDVRGKFTIRIS
ncbi:MAG: endonuclease, partial [Muribaculaceae bacterium]|nr:endonuclease [Muribaculaceae bacterium]